MTIESVCNFFEEEQRMLIYENIIEVFKNKKDIYKK
jgi:hypothetical protein